MVGHRRMPAAGLTGKGRQGEQVRDNSWVVVGTIAIAAFVLTSCGAVDGFATLEARHSIESLAEGVPDESGARVPLDHCPLASASASVTALAAELTTMLVDDGVMDAPLQAGLFRPATGAEVQVACDQFEGGDSIVGVGVYAQSAVGNLESYTRLISDADALDGTDVTVVSSATYRGGTFFHVCVRYAGELAQHSYCEVDWMDQNVLVGAYVSGERSDQINLAVLEESLSEQIVPIVERLGAAA